MTHMQSTLRDFTARVAEKEEEKHRAVDPAAVVKNIEAKPWRMGNFRKQNWGIWLHRMSPYVGKLKPAMAHCLIRASTAPGQLILDPFCGVGTVPLEADLMGRVGIGIDLNPYAATISMAKFDRHPLEEHLDWLKTIKIDPGQVNVDEISPDIRQYFHEKTLKELYALRKEILDENKIFVLGCVLGILHGHRPGHLSVHTSLVVPFKPIDKPPYKEVIPRVIDKVKRTYRNPFPLDTRSAAFHGDARYVFLPFESVGAVICSPPYYNTLDYIQDNRIRLEFLGYDEMAKDNLNGILIQKPENYLKEMKKVGIELMKVLRPGGLCIYVLGDWHKGKSHVNTAENVSHVYQEIGFTTHGIIEDAIPPNPSFPTSFKRKKLDRILIMQKP